MVARDAFHHSFNCDFYIFFALFLYTYKIIITPLNTQHFPNRFLYTPIHLWEDNPDLRAIDLAWMGTNNTTLCFIELFVPSFWQENHFKWTYCFLGFDQNFAYILITKENEPLILLLMLTTFYHLLSKIWITAFKQMRDYANYFINKKFSTNVE